MSRHRNDDRSGPHSTSYNLRGPCYAKFLLPDRVAGSVIGRGGQVLQEFEHTSGAQIKVSPPKAFFPTTSDRMVMLSGEIPCIVSAVGLVVNKLLEHGADENSMMIRITVPTTSIPAVIGKGGEIIRSLQSQTGAHLHLFDRIDGLPETVCEVKGSQSSISSAVHEIILIIQKDPRIKEILSEYYGQHAAPLQDHPAPPQQRHHYESPPPPPQPMVDPTTNPELLAYPTSIEFVIPPIAVDSILSENGAFTDYIFHQTGATVTVGDPNSTDVNVTISGPLCGVQAAHILVIKQVTDAILSDQQHRR